MAAEAVNAWDQRVYLVSESTFGTSPAIAAAQAVEVIGFDPGPAGDNGVIRPKKDRQIGRGMQADWVEGRVAPVPFSVTKSVMSRAAVDTVPDESVLYKAAGLTQTVNGSTSVVYTPSADPIASGFSPMTARRVFGNSTAAYLGQEVYGGVIQSLAFSGGDKELALVASGQASGSRWGGRLASVTMASAITATMSFSAEEGYNISVGQHYLVESEVVLVTAMTAGATSCTISRGQCSTSSATHTAVPANPHAPTITPSSGRPISEAVATFTLDSIAERVMSFGINIATGGALLPGETGSRHSQGAKFTRYDVGVNFTTALKQEQVKLIGKAGARKTCALSIVQGSTAGKVFTFAAPYCEVVAMKVPDTANDIAIVQFALRVRDDAAGSDAFSFSLT
jgi:hypothetical protein